MAMVNPNINGAKNLGEYKFAKGFPARDNCDLDNPREKFLWILVALPGQNGARMVFPVSYMMMLSEHFDECGAMLKCEACGHEKVPLKKYREPEANDPHMFTSPGRWVPASEPDPQTVPAEEAWNKLSPIQKAEFHELGRFYFGDTDVNPSHMDNIRPVERVWEQFSEAQKAEIYALAKAEHDSA